MFVVVAARLPLAPAEGDAHDCGRSLIPALIVIKLVLPGTLGAIKQSFLPAGGLVAEQQSMPGASGSGRLADLGPALQEWKQKPLVGQGFGTRVVDANVRGPAREHPRQRVARDAARDRRARLLRLALVLRARRAEARQGGEGGRLRTWLAAGLARGERRGVRGRHAHLRRVLVHPGHVPDVHLRRPRRGADGRAADAARRAAEPASQRTGRPVGAAASRPSREVRERSCCDDQAAMRRRRPMASAARLGSRRRLCCRRRYARASASASWGSRFSAAFEVAPDHREGGRLLARVPERAEREVPEADSRCSGPHGPARAGRGASRRRARPRGDGGGTGGP